MTHGNEKEDDNKEEEGRRETQRRKGREGKAKMAKKEAAQSHLARMLTPFLKPDGTKKARLQQLNAVPVKRRHQTT